MVRGRRGKKPDRHPGEESPCTGLRGLIRPCRTCPGKGQPADKKTGKAAAFPVRPEREVRGSALKGVAGGLKGLVRQFGLLLARKRTSALLEVPAAVWRLKAPSSSRWRT